MDHERVTRNTVPTVSFTLPLSLKRWADEEAKRRGLGRSAFLVALLTAERERCEADEHARELAAVPA